jgi:hypothetical protein
MKPTLRRRSIGVAMLATSLSLASASAKERNGAHTGLIVASSVYLFETPFDSAATLVRAMTHLRQPQVIGAYCNGAWRVHFAAQLEQPGGEETLDLQIDDVSRSGRSRRRIRVFSSDIPVHPGQMTLFMNDFVISNEMGFAAGHAYEVSLWRPAEAGRTVLAKGSFTLK